jgi:hypothetical protein
MLRQQAQANSRSLRSLTLPRRDSNIGCGSAQVSHSASVTASPSRPVFARPAARVKGRRPDALGGP